MWRLLSQEAPILHSLSVTQFPCSKKAAAILKNPPHTDPWWLHRLSHSPMTVQKIEMRLDSCSFFFHITFWGINFSLRETTKKHSVLCDACKWGVLRSPCLKRIEGKRLYFREYSKLILAYHLFHNLLYFDSLPDSCSIFNKRVLRVLRNKHAIAYHFSNDE